MKIFDYQCELDGGNDPHIVKMQLKENKDFQKGRMVYYDPATGKVTGTPNAYIIGICMEDYKAQETDGFGICSEYGKGYIKVNVSSNSLYKVKPYYHYCNVGYDDMLLVNIAIKTENIESIHGSKFILTEKSISSETGYEVGDDMIINKIIHISDDRAGIVFEENRYISNYDILKFVPNFGVNCFVGDELNEGEYKMEFTRAGDFSVVATDENSGDYIVRILNKNWRDAKYCEGTN